MPRHKIKALALDRQHGASFLLRQALLLLKDEAAELPCTNWRDYLQALEVVACRLQDIRPTMASIYNGLQLFRHGLAGLRAIDQPPHPVEAVSILVDGILAELDQIYSLTVKNGSDMIKSGLRLVSCSFSATVGSALLQSAAEGRACSVLIVEGRDECPAMPYGEMMASTLRPRVKCRVITAEDLEANLLGVDFALVGADSIFRDGSVVNGHPSLRLAQACQVNNIPFYCLCESHKITTQPPVLPLEAGFDLIPAHLVSKIITEKSAAAP
jgi:translation initiation factor 2B subunit (eIF-2B alpha/beta/delta family)